MERYYRARVRDIPIKVYIYLLENMSGICWPTSGYIERTDYGIQKNKWKNGIFFKKRYFSKLVAPIDMKAGR